MKLTNSARAGVAAFLLGLAVPASAAGTTATRVSDPAGGLQRTAAIQSEHCRQRIGPFRSETGAGAAVEAARQAGYAATPVVAAESAADGLLPRYFFTVAYPC